MFDSTFAHTISFVIIIIIIIIRPPVCSWAVAQSRHMLELEPKGGDGGNDEDDDDDDDDATTTTRMLSSLSDCVEWSVLE